MIRLLLVLGVGGARVDKSADDFKQFIESRGAETGAWRGDVGGSTTTG